MKIDDYEKYYIQGSDHYLIPRDEFEELFDEMLNWKAECEESNKFINNAIAYIDDLRDESAERQGFNNCFPDDLYIPNIEELLNIMTGVK